MDEVPYWFHEIDIGRDRPERKTPMHTPGPWFVEFDPNGGYDCMTSGYHVGPDPVLNSVVTVDTGRAEIEDETALANANLIAAAPDLLEVLRAAEYRLSAMAGDGVPEVLDKIRAAITKATEPT